MEPKSGGQRPGRKPVASPKVFNVTLRMSAEEYDKVKMAAGPYPASTWARVTLLDAAERAAEARRAAERQLMPKPTVNVVFPADITKETADLINRHLEDKGAPIRFRPKGRTGR